MQNISAYNPRFPAQIPDQASGDVTMHQPRWQVLRSKAGPLVHVRQRGSVEQIMQAPSMSGTANKTPRTKTRGDGKQKFGFKHLTKNEFETESKDSTTKANDFVELDCEKGKFTVIIVCFRCQCFDLKCYQFMNILHCQMGVA